MNITTAPSHAWQTLREMASAPYRSAGRFASHSLLVAEASAIAGDAA